MFLRTAVVLAIIAGVHGRAITWSKETNDNQELEARADNTRTSKCPEGTKPADTDTEDMMILMNLQEKVLKKYQVPPKYFKLTCYVKTEGYFLNHENKKEFYSQYAMQIKLGSDQYAHIIVDNVTTLNIKNDEFKIIYNGFDHKKADRFWL